MVRGLVSRLDPLVFHLLTPLQTCALPTSLLIVLHFWDPSSCNGCFCSCCESVQS